MPGNEPKRSFARLDPSSFSGAYFRHFNGLFWIMESKLHLNHSFAETDIEARIDAFITVLKRKPPLK
jgi:hypothetical protein